MLFKRLTMLAAAAALALALPVGAAHAENTKMTIGTGVDPSFSTYFIAKTNGIFDKNGLDVTLNTGPSGSAMVAFVIQNQFQSAFGAEQAGIQNTAMDPNVVVIAEGAKMSEWYGVVARDGIKSLEDLKGKNIGVARGSASEVFWLALVNEYKLDPKDYNIIQVESPEMVAALERGNIDAFLSWEPWLTRATKAIKGSSVIKVSDGIIDPRVYLYINKQWAEENPEAAKAFMKSLVEANDYISANPADAAKQVAEFLKLDPEMTASMMSKIRYKAVLDNGSLGNIIKAEQQLKQLGKLAKPVNWEVYIYPDLIKAVSPDVVNYELPK